MTGFPPTPEQADALDKFRTGYSLAIEAGAGTGKTSTLELIGEDALVRNLRGQYLAFNKAIVVEAKEKMPSNVRSNTAHSLAFGAVGRKYKARMDSSRRMRSLDIAARLGIDEIVVTVQDGTRKKLSRSFLAGLVMRSVVNFCQSADAMPGPEHVPYVKGIDIPPGRIENNLMVAKAIAPAVRLAWLDAIDVNGSLPYRHDYYLKQWQLEGPRIAADFILFDEAQDANPVMVAIVSAQEQHGTQLVWVGDSQQQIYSFTGAVNALAGVPAQHRSFLTQSFRFGPAIADVANRVLGDLNAELRLVGTESIESVVGSLPDPNVILTRTNATAVRSVLEAQSLGQTVHLVGGGKEIVAFAKGAADLMAGRSTEHADLACFSTWSEVREYVDQDEQGAELRLNVKLVEEFGVDVILAALDNMVREDLAELVVSTAHKSKGREWDRVLLGDDFPADPSGEELRLLYVAVTRAKLVLDTSRVPYFNVTTDPHSGMADRVLAEIGDPDAQARLGADRYECPNCGHSVVPIESVKTADKITFYNCPDCDYSTWEPGDWNPVEPVGDGWVYMGAADIAEAAECDCDLCRRITAEGVTPASSVDYRPESVR